MASTSESQGSGPGRLGLLFTALKKGHFLRASVEAELEGPPRMCP